MSITDANYNIKTINDEMLGLLRDVSLQESVGTININATNITNTNINTNTNVLL